MASTVAILQPGHCLADHATPVGIADDYARAERFLSWNKDRYVINADIQHYWIGDEDRFWYRRTNAVGDKEFVVVDAATGERTAAFDHGRIARLLTKATGKDVKPGQLPFTTFRYSEEGAAVQFLAADKVWECGDQAKSKCVVVQAKVQPGEANSPDGKWAAFLRDGNIWIRPTSGEAAFALTADATDHHKYGMSPGSSTHAVSDARFPKPVKPQVIWSPDSRFLLTHQIDERSVREFFLLQSVPDDGSTRPLLYKYRYPLPGDAAVPSVEIVLFDVAARRQIKLSAPVLICPVLTPVEQRSVWWSADSTNIYYLNRDRFSRMLALNEVEAVTGSVREMVLETSDAVVVGNTNNVFDYPAIKVLSSGDVIWYSQRDGWGHLYYYNGATGTLRNQITQGEWMVRSVVRVNEAQRRVYFMASGREAGRDPYEQYLYSVAFDGSGMQLLTPEVGEHESHAGRDALADVLPGSAVENGRFSRSGRFLVDSYSRPDQPPTLVVRAVDGKLIRQLEQADISKLRDGGYTPIEAFSALAADSKTIIHGNLFRPSSFDPSRKYPVIDAIYPGPQVTRTRKSFMAATFDTFEAQSLAELGFVVVTLDGRGTPHRSRTFGDYAYKRISRASDIEDHIAATRQLAKSRPYMDLARVGIDGVSAGGYAAAHAILSHPEFYKVAVAASGTHDLRAYVAPWGEVYNGPVTGGDYESASNLALAANLKGKLLLMHGDMDDNVSPALTLKLADALIKANKDFDLLIIPNGDHRSWMSPYFIRRKWNYFVSHLLQQEPPSDYSIHRP